MSAFTVVDRRSGAQLPTREVRTPSAATQPAGWVSPIIPQVPKWDAQQAIDRALYANMYVYRCCEVIARALTRMPIRVGADPDRPTDYIRTGRVGLRGLLGYPVGRPNDEITARQLTAWSLVQWLVTGRMAWELDRNDAGQVVGLWPIPATRFRPISSTGGARYFAGYSFLRSDGQWRSVGLDGFFYAWRPSADDVREPESVLQAAALDVSIAVMQDRYDWAFLRNGSTPAAMVIGPTMASLEDQERFERQFSTEFRGPNNAGKTAFAYQDPGSPLGGEGAKSPGWDVKVLGATQKDAQALERSQEMAARITEAFGVPMSKIGDASGRTYSNAGAEDRNFYQETVIPVAGEIAEQINHRLAPLFGDNVMWFDQTVVEALQAPTPGFVALDLLGARDRGIVGDDYVRTQIGATPDDVGEPVAPPAPEEAEPAVDEPTPPTPIAAARPAPESRQDDEQAREQRRVKLWNDTDSKVRDLEDLFEQEMGKLFRRQQTEVLKRLEGKRGRQAARAGEVRLNVATLFTVTHWRSETEDAAALLFRSVATIAGTALADRFGVSFTVRNSLVRRFIARRAKQLAGQVTDTTYAAIRDALAVGAEQGEGIPKLAGRVRHVFDVATQARARTIARTEVISAYNGATEVAAAGLDDDVIGGKEWIATRDSRTREHHRDADGQTVGRDEAFRVGGHDLRYPGDPSAPAGEVVNCRCTIGYLTPAEMDDRGAARSGAMVSGREARAMLTVLCGRETA